MPNELTNNDPKWKNSPTEETATTSQAERRLAVSVFVPADIVSSVCIERQSQEKEDAERPRSAEKRLVAIWNSCTASCEMFTSGPPTASSLLSVPSIIMLPPRPSWPAEEMRTLPVLVGSKFGAGVAPGTSKASSR